MLLSLGKGFFLFLMRQTIIVMSRLVEYDQKNEIFNQYQSLGFDFYSKENTGDLMNRIGAETDRINVFLSLHLLDFATDILMILMTDAILISIDPWMKFELNSQNTQ